MTAGRSKLPGCAPMARPTPAASSTRAACRAARALGYTRLITYTLPAAGGASLRVAGWRLVGRWQLEPSAPAAPGHPRGAARAQAGVGGAVAARPGACCQCGQPPVPIAARARAGVAPRLAHVPLTSVSSMPGQSRSSRLRRGSDRVDQPVRSGIPARTAIGSPDGDATQAVPSTHAGVPHLPRLGSGVSPPLCSQSE